MITNEFKTYKFEDTVASELHNNILIIDKIVQKRNLRSKPQFFILGGAALVLYSLNYNATLDIDTANKIEEGIREDVSLFINDGAHLVTSLGSKYQERAQRYCKNELTSIEVYLLSYEDLLLTKLFSGRRKDMIAILTSGILQVVDREKVKKILFNEYTESHRLAILGMARRIGVRLEA